MKALRSLLMALALLALMALPAFAQGDSISFDLAEQNYSGISGLVTLIDVGDGTTEVYLTLQGADPEGEYPAHIHAGQCPEPGAITHPLQPVVFDAVVEGSESVTVLDISFDKLLAEGGAINAQLHTDPSVYVACGDLPAAGTSPDNQQGGMVTKTFELTLNGDVPEGQAFFAQYLVEGQPEHTAESVTFCADVDPDLPKCEGDGTVYRESVQLPAGSGLGFRFIRSNEVGDLELFHEGNETLNADMTNTAFYTFGTDVDDDQQDDDKDTGAGDDKQVPDNQQDGEDKDTGKGAGDEQQPPDNQQDDTQDTGTGAGDEQQDDTQADTQDDVQDDLQGEMPEEMPDTGAGGLAGGAAIPVGNAAGLTLLLGAGYAVVRRR